MLANVPKAFLEYLKKFDPAIANTLFWYLVSLEISINCMVSIRPDVLHGRKADVRQQERVTLGVGSIHRLEHDLARGRDIAESGHLDHDL